MADFQNFQVNRTGDMVSISLPQCHITCDVVNSSNGQTIQNYDLFLDQALSILTLDDMDDLARVVAEWIIKRKTNIE